MRLSYILLVAMLFVLTASLSATIFGSISGLIHDPQHRPVQGASVVVRSETSEWSNALSSDSSGEFRFDAVPLGNYTVTIEMPGFTKEQQQLTLTSGRDAKLHFVLTIAQPQE